MRVCIPGSLESLRICTVYSSSDVYSGGNDHNIHSTINTHSVQAYTYFVFSWRLSPSQGLKHHFLCQQARSAWSCSLHGHRYIKIYEPGCSRTQITRSHVYIRTNTHIIYANAHTLTCAHTLKYAHTLTQTHTHTHTHIHAHILTLRIEIYRWVEAY